MVNSVCLDQALQNGHLMMAYTVLGDDVLKIIIWGGKSVVLWLEMF